MAPLHGGAHGPGVTGPVAADAALARVGLDLIGDLAQAETAGWSGGELIARDSRRRRDRSGGEVVAVGLVPGGIGSAAVALFSPAVQPVQEHHRRRSLARLCAGQRQRLDQNHALVGDVEGLATGARTGRAPALVPQGLDQVGGERGGRLGPG